MGLHKRAYGQVKKIEEQNRALAAELRKALGEVERLAHERDRFAAMLGAEHAKQTSPPKGDNA